MSEPKIIPIDRHLIEGARRALTMALNAFEKGLEEDYLPLPSIIDSVSRLSDFLRSRMSEEEFEPFRKRSLEVLIKVREATVKEMTKT
jgi:hypothetical protein